MLYLFEDSPDSALSILYKAGYPKEMQSKLMFCSSSSKLEKKVSKLLTTTDEDIVAFIDLIPDNKNTVELFRNLFDIQNDNPDRLKVVPLVCSEFYLLKGLEHSQYITNKQIVQICLDLICHWVDSSWMESKHGCRSFEKYCKHAMKAALLDCFTKESKQRKFFYMRGDCYCGFPYTGICTEQLQVEKAIKYLKSFPLLPQKSFVQGLVKVEESDYRNYVIREVHRHNERVHMYIQHSPQLEFLLLQNIINTNDEGWPC